MIGIYHYLIVAAALFCIGIYSVIAKKNAIAVMIGLEFILNAVNINLIAINHFLFPNAVTGQIFVLFIIGVAAAEVALALAIVLALYRQNNSVFVDEMDVLKW